MQLYKASGLPVTTVLCVSCSHYNNCNNHNKACNIPDFQSDLIASSPMTFIQPNTLPHIVTKCIQAVFALFYLSKGSGIIIRWNSDNLEDKEQGNN